MDDLFRVFQKTQKFKNQKKQIIFPLVYMSEHSMPNFGLLGGREAFPQMAIHFTKELPLKYKGKYEKLEFYKFCKILCRNISYMYQISLLLSDTVLSIPIKAMFVAKRIYTTSHNIS